MVQPLTSVIALVSVACLFGWVKSVHGAIFQVLEELAFTLRLARSFLIR